MKRDADEKLVKSKWPTLYKYEIVPNIDVVISLSQNSTSEYWTSLTALCDQDPRGRWVKDKNFIGEQIEQDKVQIITMFH